MCTPQSRNARLHLACASHTELCKLCEPVGAAQGVISGQSMILPSTVLPQSLSQYGSSYPQPAMLSAAAPLLRPARSNDPRQRNPEHSSRQPDVPVSREASHSGTRNGAKHLESLPDISAEELPLRFVDRGKLEFSAERMKVRPRTRCFFEEI